MRWYESGGVMVVDWDGYEVNMMEGEDGKRQCTPVHCFIYVMVSVLKSCLKVPNDFTTR